MGYALDIGWRYLRAKKRSTVSVITFVAVTGVALGVGALLSVMSITAGFQEEFRTKVLGVNAHVLVLRYGLDFSDYENVVRRAQAMPDVEGAAPFEIDEMMLSTGDRASAGILVKGVDPVLLRTVLDLPSQIVRGSLDGLRRPGAMAPTRPEDVQRESHDDAEWRRFLEDSARDIDGDPLLEPLAAALDAGVPDAGVPSVAAPHVATLAEIEAALAGGGLFTDELPEPPPDEPSSEPVTPAADLPGIVVGISLAESLGLEVGDRVKIVSPLAGLDPALWRPNAGTPRAREFRVIGVFQAGFQEYDTRLVYADLYEAQALADRGNTVTGVEIRLHDLERAPDVARRIERELGGGPYHTLDWQELNHNLFTALAIQKVMLSLVIATIIFVAAFNVIATLIMIVLEKKREIAILKAMGATDFAVLTIFLLQGVVIGVVGTAIGLVLGGGLCTWLERVRYPLDPKVYLIDHLPVRMSWAEFVATVLVALVICVCATLVPSWWAARMRPVDGVRYE